jgi:hypothetical protein
MKSSRITKSPRTGQYAAPTKDNLGNSPTNKPIAVQGLLYARIENGQVIENHLLIDQMGVLQQLGLIPPPRPTAVLRGE